MMLFENTFYKIILVIRVEMFYSYISEFDIFDNQVQNIQTNRGGRYKA